MNPEIQKKKIDFIKDHHSEILSEGIKHKDKVGYMQMFVDEDFNFAFNGIEFIEGEFDREKFTQINNPKPGFPDTITDSSFMYYSILWIVDKTKHDIKELVLMGEVPPDRFDEVFGK